MFCQKYSWKFFNWWYVDFVWPSEYLINQSVIKVKSGYILRMLLVCFRSYIKSVCCLFSVALRPNAGHGLLILEVSWSHTNDATQSVGLLFHEWSARRTDLYLTTHNTHNRQTSMPPVGFEPAISAGDRAYTYALDRAATGTGVNSL